MTEELEIGLTKGQAEFLMSDALFPGYFAGYGAGKSHIMGLAGVTDMMHSSSCIIGFYEPTYDLIKTIAYPRVDQWLVELGIRGRLNQQDKMIYTSNSGVGDALFRSLENIDALIGYETYRTHVDEFDTLTTANAGKAFNKILGRNRQAPYDVPEEHKRWCEESQKYECVNTFRTYSTPEGFKFCYKMWHPDGENARNNPEFKLYKGRTYDNPKLTTAYINSLKATYPAALLQAYMEGEFVNLESGTVYYNFCRKRHNTTRTIQKEDVLKIGIDFNVMNTCGIVFVDDDKLKKISIVAEIVKQLDTPALIKAIKNRWPNHTIICYPDNTGKARGSNNADPNANNIALLKAAGFNVRTKTGNPKIKNRVTSVVKVFEDEVLQVNVAECPTLTQSFEQQCYDDKGEPDKSSGLDHVVDAAGYRIEHTHSIKKPIFEIASSFAQKR